MERGEPMLRFSFCAGGGSKIVTLMGTRVCVVGGASSEKSSPNDGVLRDKNSVLLRL
jgi:hypothetical protein